MAEEHEETTEEEQPEAEASEEQAAAEADAEEPAAEAEAEAPAADAEEPAAAQAGPAAEAAEQPRRKRKRIPRSERRQRPRPKRERPAEAGPPVRVPKPERVRGARQERRGVVVSSAMDKTIVVRVETLQSHPRYKKIIRRSAKLHAHDERNEAKVGDVVRIVETRPLSRTKRWRLAEVLEVAK